MYAWVRVSLSVSMGLYRRKNKCHFRAAQADIWMAWDAYGVVGLDEGIVDGDNLDIVVLDTIDRCQLNSSYNNDQ
jgi:hypothetical protein